MSHHRIKVFLGGYVNFLNVQNISCRTTLFGRNAKPPTSARSDLQSDRLGYKDLQSDYRITNAYIHCGWIANPAERENRYLYFKTGSMIYLMRMLPAIG